MKIIKTTLEPVAQSFNTITVELEYAEALVLRDIFQFIGGSPTLSRRGIIDNMIQELRPHFKKVTRPSDVVGNIEFANHGR